MELSRDGLKDFAKMFVRDLPPLGTKAYVVGLRGDLGAGKTTFVQEVGKVLGVKESITSPTFVIAQSYTTTHPVFKRLVHMDAYRLKGEVGDTIGFGNYLHNPENLVLVEWPENLPAQANFPAHAPSLQFETTSETTRRVSNGNE